MVKTAIKKAAPLILTGGVVLASSGLEAALDNIIYSHKIETEQIVLSKSLSEMFYLGVLKGRENPEDDDKSVLNNGQRSRAVIRINGKTHNLTPGLTGITKIHGTETTPKSMSSVYTYKDTKLNIYEEFRFVKLPNSNLGDLVQVYYGFENASEQNNSYKIGFKVLLDLFLGVNTKQMNKTSLNFLYDFHVIESRGAASTRDVPEELISIEGIIEDPGFHCIFSSSNLQLTKPDKVIFGEMNELTTMWEVDYNAFSRKSLPKKVSAIKDNAVAMYWDDTEFKPGDQRFVSFLIAPAYHELQTKIGDIPMSLAYYRMGDKYRILVGVQNKYEKSLTDTTITLNKGEFDVKVTGETIGEVIGGGVAYAIYEVTPKGNTLNLEFVTKAKVGNNEKRGFFKKEIDTTY